MPSMSSKMEIEEIKKNHRLTVTQAAKVVGVSAKTIRRWEEAGKVSAPKKDWRGWRVYFPEDVEQLTAFHEAVY
jgi:excisionase family DNA binding protein